MKIKICPRLLILDLSDCTLRIFRGYDFSIFLTFLFLDRYFGVFDSDLQASPPPPPVCLVIECADVNGNVNKGKNALQWGRNVQTAKR